VYSGKDFKHDLFLQVHIFLPLSIIVLVLENNLFHYLLVCVIIKFSVCWCALQLQRKTNIMLERPVNVQLILELIQWQQNEVLLLVIVCLPVSQCPGDIG